MFKSKRRPIAVPQSEHLKLVGALAFVWGNADFDLPQIDRASLVAGVGLHDRGYGYLDDDPIGEMPEERRIAITRRGFDMSGSDPVADLITRYHLKRLMANSTSPAIQELHAEFAREIEAQLHRQGLSAAFFERIDRITNLCDLLSLGFCFEDPAEGQVSVFPHNTTDAEVAVHYVVRPAGITVTPWPFSIPSIAGYLVGYRLPDYPARLDPVILPYLVSPEKCYPS